MSPENWKNVWEYVSYAAIAIASIFTTLKVQSGRQGVSSHIPEESASAILAAVEQLGEKIDRMNGAARLANVRVDGIAEDQQRQGQEISRLSNNMRDINSELRDVTGRVVALESRMPRPM